MTDGNDQVCHCCFLGNRGLILKSNAFRVFAIARGEVRFIYGEA
jgi:hypothetical protein